MPARIPVANVGIPRWNVVSTVPYLQVAVALTDLSAGCAAEVPLRPRVRWAVGCAVAADRLQVVEIAALRLAPTAVAAGAAVAEEGTSTRTTHRGATRSPPLLDIGLPLICM